MALPKLLDRQLCQGLYGCDDEGNIVVLNDADEVNGEEVLMGQYLAAKPGRYSVTLTTFLHNNPIYRKLIEEAK